MSIKITAADVGKKVKRPEWHDFEWLRILKVEGNFFAAESDIGTEGIHKISDEWEFCKKQDPAIANGIKHDSDKPRVDLVSSIATIERAKVYSFGAQKYGEHNWRKGLAWSRVVAACFRHLLAWVGGEDNDPESGINHLAHAAVCIDFLIEYTYTQKALDDRYKEKTQND